MVRSLLVALSLTLVAASSFAQSEPRFTVASIRPSVDNEPGMAVRPLANGGYSGRKVPLTGLLTAAFGVSPDRIVGAPQWPDRWDIEARYEPLDTGPPVPPLSMLLRSLLRERFGLAAHMEKRELPVYVLKPLRTDGRLGPRLTTSALTCADAAAATAARERNETAANGAPLCGAIERPDAFIASGMTMDVLARALRIPAGRDVINGTGLAGTWDLMLEFAPLGDTASDKPPVFTALQEQLGLKLESGTARLDVLVIDAITRPTAN